MSPSASRDDVGLVVGNRYRLITKLAAGTATALYLADDVRLRRRVTVEILDESLAAESGFLERFRAEMTAAAALRHPHTAVTYDWGVDRVPFVVGEFFANGSLRELIERGIRLDAPQVLAVTLAAARALAYAHGQGVVHRDVSPRHLVFADDGRVAIAGFGLARAFAAAASTEPMGVAAAAGRYASPEQAKGHDTDGKSDVYSLVLAMIEAATGTVPFQADTALASLLARIDRAPVIPGELDVLGDVFARATAIEPAERLDAAGLVTALMAVADDLGRPEPIVFRAATPGVDDDGDDITLVVLADGADAVLGVGNAPLGDTIDAASETDVRDQVRVPVDEADLGTAPAALGAPGTKNDVGEAGRGAGEDDGEVESDRDVDGGVAVSDRGRRRWRIAWAVFALVVVLGGSGVGFIVWRAHRTPTHPVPAVAGLNPVVAAQRLERLGFRVRTTRIRKDGTVAGQIISVDPPPGHKVAEGDTVTLTVSEGQTLVTLPKDLIGVSADAGEARIEKLGLTPREGTSRFSEDIDAGKVVATTPTVGGRIEKGSTVTVYVSRGPRPRVIPDVSQMTPDQAEAALRDLGLVPTVVSQYDTKVDTGGLIGLDPGTGTSVPRGTSVKVVVSKGLLVAVPSLAGVTSVNAATAKLQAVGLVPGKIQGSGELTGTPVAFDPPAGQLVVKGSRVDIVVR